MADVGRITELWRAAADALELPGDVEGTVPSQWLLDEKMRRQRAEAECGRLREQLDAARKALQHYADQDTWDLDQLSYDESNTAGYVFWHYDGHRAEEPWAVARAALGVEGEQEKT